MLQQITGYAPLLRPLDHGQVEWYLTYLKLTMPNFLQSLTTYPQAEGFRGVLTVPLLSQGPETHFLLMAEEVGFEPTKDLHPC